MVVSRTDGTTVCFIAAQDASGFLRTAGSNAVAMTMMLLSRRTGSSVIGAAATTIATRSVAGKDHGHDSASFFSSWLVPVWYRYKERLSICLLLLLLLKTDACVVLLLILLK